TTEELSSSEDACFNEGIVTNEKSESLHCANLCGYDEEMRTSILDFNEPVSIHVSNLTYSNHLSNKTYPRAISENDSLCIYDASPSPHQDEEINFMDELPEIEETVNKWTPEALINFAKGTLRENFETIKQPNENHEIGSSTFANISKSLGSLDLWETKMGWITRVPSPSMDHCGIGMRQSISCHDRMITSYVDCVIQNHYNRCSSPDCHKYASKPEDGMKQTMMNNNSGSDTSDDEWIRCVDDVQLEDTHGNDCLHNEIYPQVTVPIFSQHNDNNNSYIINQQNFNDMDKNKEMIMKCKQQPTTTFFNVLKNVTNDENMMNVSNQIDNFDKEEFLSYHEKNQYSILVDPIPCRSYS
ncbi:hypothetical protein LOAG_11433, partial [Loa loa]